MDDQLKQRLVGVAVLAVVGIIFIPMILPGPPKDVEEALSPVALNPPPSMKFSSSIVATESAGPNEDPIAHSESPPDEQADGDSVNIHTESFEGLKASARGWAVQLGAFGTARNALALRERLKARGYKAFVETSEQDGKQVTRVLVGPTRGKTEAEVELQKLRAATSLSGILVRFPRG